MADPTAYIVLRGYEDIDGPPGKLESWKPHGEPVAATSAEAAIRAAVKDIDKPAGTYVTVPQRSWKPVTVSAVQTTVLKLEDAAGT